MHTQTDSRVAARTEIGGVFIMIGVGLPITAQAMGVGGDQRFVVGGQGDVTEIRIAGAIIVEDFI